jgi:hypothetical protein
MAAIVKSRLNRWLVASTLLAGAGLGLNGWQVKSSESAAKPRVESRAEMFRHTLTPPWETTSVNAYPVGYSPITALRPTPFSYEGPYKSISDYRAITGEQFDESLPLNKPKQSRRSRR